MSQNKSRKKEVKKKQKQNNMNSWKKRIDQDLVNGKVRDKNDKNKKIKRK